MFNRSAPAFFALLASPLLPVLACAPPEPDVAATESAVVITTPSTSTMTGVFGKCVAVNATTNVSPAILKPCDDASSLMRWTYTSAQEIKGPGGRCLNAEGFQSTNGTRVVLYDCDGGANEKWTFTSDGHVLGLGGKCITTSGGSHADNAQLVLGDCSTASSQKWLLPRQQVELPLELVQMQRDDGSGFAFDPTAFQAQVAKASRIYERVGIKLTFNPTTDFTTVRSTLLYNSLRQCFGDQTCLAGSAEATRKGNVIAGSYRGKIVLFLNEAGTASYSSQSPDDLNFVSFGKDGDWTFIVHELGHYFGLNHTQGGVPDGMTVAAYLQSKGNDANVLDGDVNGPRGPISDTPANPPERAYTEAGRNASTGPCAGPLQINGVWFDPDQADIMNYNPGCVGPVRSISPDQGRLMLATLYAADRKHLSNAFIPLRTSDVAVGTTLDGRTQIFVSGNDGRVASRWKVGDSNSNWTDWSSFDGFGPVSSIATVRHTRSEVFAISGGKLFNRYQFNDQGGWTSWTSFAPESDYLDVATAIASDGRRMLWASTTDGRLWSFIKASTDPSSGWIGRTLVASDNVGPFTIATIPNANRLQLFEISGTRLKTRWQNSNGGWSNLDDFGLSAFDVSAGRTQDGRLAVYAVALDGTLWVREKISTDPNSSWKDWQKLPSSQNYDFLGVVAGNLQDGRPQLFGIRYGGVWSAYWDGSSWQGWWTF